MKFCRGSSLGVGRLAGGFRAEPEYGSKRRDKYSFLLDLREMPKTPQNIERQDGLRILFAKDVTTMEYPWPSAQTEEPKGDGILQLDEGRCASLIFFGAGNWGSRAIAAILGWKFLPGKTPLWIPLPLARVNLTIGNITGVDGSPIDASHHFVSEIDVVKAYTQCEIAHNCDDVVAEMRLKARDVKYLQVVLATMSQETSLNVIAQQIDKL